MENKTVINSVASTAYDIRSSADDELISLRKKNSILKANISTLYKTAKAEIDRKDKRISDLQSELDNLIFRRSGNNNMLGVVQLINEANNYENNNETEIALRVYKSAFNSILEVNGQMHCSTLNPLPGTSPVEVRSVADYINYRVCHLQFLLNHPREAIAQFRRFIDTFKHHTKEPEYVFEHAAWLSQQYLLFADLFNQAIADGIKASKAQHPGYYYQEVALQMIDRRKNITEYTNDTIRSNNMPVTNELLSMFSTSNFPSFLRLCGWTCVEMNEGPPVGNVAKQTSDQEVKNDLTSPINYSDIIIRSLYKAMEYFEEWDKPRMLNYIGVLLADEYMLINDLSKAQVIYKRSLQSYEHEKWTLLAEEVRKKLISAETS